MLLNAFKRVSKGVKCQKCGSIISHNYVKRHNQECQGVEESLIVEEEDDGIEILEIKNENIEIIEPSTSKPKGKDVPKQEEIVMLSDSDDE